MPVKLVPPSRNAAAEHLMKLFAQTEQKLIAEITRKRAAGYVDYAETAALRRVRETMQKMVDESAKYVPLAIEKEFYKGEKHAAGYRNARQVVTPGRTRTSEILTDNLLGQIQEMAGNALADATAKMQLIGRPDADIFRTLGLRTASQNVAIGASGMGGVEAMARALEASGITAFVDKAGRPWSLRAYGNMAVRTTVKQAQVSAVLTEDDHDLYQIVRHNAPCRLCATYSGRVYSKSGTNPHYPPLAMAFGKIDPAGPNDLSNSFLNIHPNCLVPGGFVLAEGVVSESRRFYNGEVVRLKTSGGNEISVTPNHPILTDRGFVAAGALKEGDKIIETTGEYGAFIGKAPNNINIPSAVDEVFHTLMQARGGASCRMEGSAVQFHGDGIPDSKVDIVFTDCLGRDKINAARNKEVAEKNFPSAKSRGRLFFAFCPFLKVFKSAFASAHSIMRGLGFVFSGQRITENTHDFADGKKRATANFCNFGICFSLIMKVKESLKKLAMFVKVFLGNIKLPALLTDSALFDKTFNSKIVSNADDVIGTNTELFGNFFTGEPVIEKRLQDLRRNNVLVVSRLTHKETSLYCGYVYNFETKHNFYSYNNIITHNCLCTLTKYTEAGKTEKQIEQMREASSFAKHPADVDPRTQKEIEAYRRKERNRAELMGVYHEWERMREQGIAGVPTSFNRFWDEYKKDSPAYNRWLSSYTPPPKNKPKPVQPAPIQQAPAPAPVFVSAYKPAATIEEAEDLAKHFADKNAGFAATGISYKGVSVEVANKVNKTLYDFYDEYDVPMFGGVIAPAGNTRYGKMIKGATAAYSPLQRSFLLNRATLKDMKTATAALKAEKDAIVSILEHPEKYDFDRMSTRVRKVVEASKLSGRATVPETIEEVISHELGHALERNLKDYPGLESIRANMPKYAEKISGYATESFSEYVAESFASFRKGENLADPELVKAFESFRRVKP